MESFCNIIYYRSKGQGQEGFFSFFGKKWKINTFIQQGCIKLIKSDGKDMYNVTKAFYFR